MLDPPFLSNLDNLSRGEELSVSFGTLGDMATAFTVGTVTQLPAATVPYADLSNKAKVGLAFPLNIVAAAGGGSGLAITLRGQYDLCSRPSRKRSAAAFLDR